MDHNTVFRFGYCQWQNRWWHQNVPPLLAISMAMAVRRSNTDSIGQCSMSRAILEATGRCYWATTHSVSPQRPPGQQQTKGWRKNEPTLLAIFDGHGGAPVQYRAHCPIEEVHGFGRSHWMPPSGKYCGQYMQLVTHTPFWFWVFTSSTYKKRLLVDAKTPVFNRGMTYQTKEKGLTKVSI